MSCFLCRVIVAAFSASGGSAAAPSQCSDSSDFSDYPKITPMKSPGSILEFTHDRNRELMSAFRKAIADRPFIDITEVSEAIVNMPCSRFWVSEERAMVVVTAMLKGKPILAAMRPTKREMFQEIYNRVLRLRASRPDAPISILVSQVVNSPAPKFYLRPRCAMEIIYKLKKGFYKKPL